ncbi:MAG TPA: penicillin-binding transpeptidase domain-containing protein [Blastocatellia bacterium]|nr:penicillin-binding transpeptidase domain-containing protein [Blastocatellia bacterium]
MVIPFSLTIVFTIAGLLLALLLAWAAWRHRNPSSAGNAQQEEPQKEQGSTAANPWLRGMRAVFVLLLIAAFGFHSYWIFKADSTDEFARSKRLDARNRRLADSGLKGWVLDRSGKIENALVRYRNDGGVITRDYPLREAAAHLTGYSDFMFGSGGIEYAFREWLTEPAGLLNRALSPAPVGKDFTTSIDATLQKEVFDLLDRTGKAAAAVVLLLPNNEVLALASTPSFDPRAAADEKSWRNLIERADKAQHISPLVNRSLGTMVGGGPSFYYRPGSTFKVFTAAVAIDSAMTGEIFTCRPGGFQPPASGRPIGDYAGSVHGSIGLADAFKHSCNQYFAQLALKIGRMRLADYARRLHFEVDPEAGGRIEIPWQVSHANAKDFDFIFGPPEQRLNLSSDATPFDVSLQGLGQGYNDVSVLQMALLASAVAGTDGAYVAPSLETGGERKVAGQFITPESAAKLRELMKLVVQSGTAASAFASIDKGLTAGGKTGTADREVPLYDRQGNPVTWVDENGKKHTRRVGVTDSWFIGFAPADNPRIAYAVMVEGGGAGGHVAAPIAVKLIEKAAQLGYMRNDKSAAPDVRAQRR